MHSCVAAPKLRLRRHRRMDHCRWPCRQPEVTNPQMLQGPDGRSNYVQLSTNHLKMAAPSRRAGTPSSAPGSHPASSGSAGRQTAGCCPGRSPPYAGDRYADRLPLGGGVAIKRVFGGAIFGLGFFAVYIRHLPVIARQRLITGLQQRQFRHRRKFVAMLRGKGL